MQINPHARDGATGAGLAAVPRGFCRDPSSHFPRLLPGFVWPHVCAAGAVPGSRSARPRGGASGQHSRTRGRPAAHQPLGAVPWLGGGCVGRGPRSRTILCDGSLAIYIRLGTTKALINITKKTHIFIQSKKKDVLD